jgi:chondroitin 4-sulfotransferase 11
VNKIFIHIPKTAGTSISEILNLKISHKIANDYNKKIWESSFKFCVIRNPYDRLLSHYMFHKNHYNGNFFKKINVSNIEKLSFDEYTDMIIKFNNKVNNFKSQKTFITHSSGIEIDYICRFENLENDWLYLKDKLKLPDLPHNNKSDHSIYRDYYTEKTKKFVEKFYKEDLEFFEYFF